MLNFAWVIISALLLPAVYAAEWDKLNTDIELFEQFLQENNTALENLQQDALQQATGELFPTYEERETSSSTLHEPFAIIEIDGATIMLQDVPTSEWYSQYVQDAASRKIISGYRDTQGVPTGVFGPADSVTIGQLAKMAVLAAGIDIYTCGETLKNNSALSDWSKQYIQCAEAQHWIVYSDGSIDVKRNATRAEVAVTILQAFSARITSVSGTIFSDVSRATVYGNAVETAAVEGIVSGYSDKNGNPSGYFGPTDSVNRAETAKMFSLALKRYGS